MRDSAAYAVIDADQRGSRRGADRVSDALASLRSIEGLVLPFERTAGDEIQALTRYPDAVLSTVVALSRADGPGAAWRIGIGLGPVEPLDGIASTREARGAAYVRARQAVEHAGHAPADLALIGSGASGSLAESALIALRALLTRRTPKGWEVVDALAGPGRDAKQSEVAANLGVSESAVSQRLERAQWREVRHAERLARHHLAVALGE